MCVASTRHQTSRLRESRVRGGAASWASLAAAAVCGGVPRENAISRRASGGRRIPNGALV